MTNFRIWTVKSLFIFFYSFSISLGVTGEVKGRVLLPTQKKTKHIPFEKYTRKISGKVAPPPAAIAGIWLTQPNLEIKEPPQTISFGQKNYQFSKSLLIVQKDTTVFFPNLDDDYHNIYSLAKVARFDLGRYKANEDPHPSYRFEKTGFINLYCEIHKHMRAAIIVVNTPYYVLSDASGYFTFPQDIPSGEYTLHAQIEKKERWTQSISVPEKGTVVIQIPQQK